LTQLDMLVYTCLVGFTDELMRILGKLNVNIAQCWNWPKRTGGRGGVSCRNWNFAQGLKFKADFHSKNERL